MNDTPLDLQRALTLLALVALFCSCQAEKLEQPAQQEPDRLGKELRLQYEDPKLRHVSLPPSLEACLRGKRDSLYLCKSRFTHCYRLEHERSAVNLSDAHLHFQNIDSAEKAKDLCFIGSSGLLIRSREECESLRWLLKRHKHAMKIEADWDYGIRSTKTEEGAFVIEFTAFCVFNEMGTPLKLTRFKCLVDGRGQIEVAKAKIYHKGPSLSFQTQQPRFSSENLEMKRKLHLLVRDLNNSALKKLPPVF